MNVEKNLKRWLKRKMKITQALIITFLITGSIGYSQVITTDSGQITIKDSNTTLKVEKTGIVDGRENISTTDSLGYVGVKNVSGNGVMVKSNIEDTILENVEIENIGIITGGLTSKVDNKPLLTQRQGNGIYDGERISKIENNGKIIGEINVKGTLFADLKDEDYQDVEGQIYKSGNGIYGGTVIKNTGAIEGNVNSEGGKIKDTTKFNVCAPAEVVRSGNGVVGEVEENSGTIKGKVFLKGGESILAQEDLDPTQDEVQSYADVSSGYDYGSDDIRDGKSGNGVYGKVKNNSGVITGSIDLHGGLASGRALENIEAGAETTATLSGNGVLGEVEENSGTIIGNAVLKGGSAIGIVNGTTETDAEAEVYTEAIAKTSGNGIYGGIKNNSGTIIGSIDLEGGALNKIDVGGDVGILNESTIAYVGTGNIAEAYVYGSAEAIESGNGIVYSVEENSGTIKGSALLNGSTIGGEIEAEAEGKEAYAEAYSNAYAEKSGNGVEGEIGKNSGTIEGKAILKGGIAKGDAERQFFDEGNDVTPEIAEVNVDSGARADESGNGVLGAVVENSGLIGGRVILQGGTAISQIEGIKNKSDVSATADANISGNGVVGKVDTNSGRIVGRADLQGGTTKVELNGPTADSTVESNVGAYSKDSGNGILGDAGENSGIIEGSSRSNGGSEEGTISEKDWVYGWAERSGNGIYGANAGENSGIIRGRVDLIKGNVNETEIGAYSELSGNGIAFYGEVKDFTNSGLVAGSKSAIAAILVNNIVNNGVMAGQKIYSDEQDSMGAIDESGTTNNGIYIKLNENGRVVDIENSSATGTIYDDREIINTDLKNSNLDSYDTFTTDLSNKILNGAGIENGVMTVDGTVKVENSIVNGYEKAVTLNDGASLTTVDTVFNGGGIGTIEDNGTPDDIRDDYVRYNPIIVGSDGNNELTLAGKTIVNGDIDMRGGTDNYLIVGSSVQLNGNLYGSENQDSQDRLDFGSDIDSQEENGLIFAGEVKAVEKITVNHDTTLTPDAKITGADTTTIADEKNLYLKSDPTKKDEKGRLTGHAYADNEGTIVSEEGGEGNLVLDTGGYGSGQTIAMGSTGIDKNVILKTDSIMYEAELDENGDVVVGVEDDLIVPPADGDFDIGFDIDYEKLDLVYKSIISSGDANIDALYPTVGGVEVNEPSNVPRAIAKVEVSKTSEDAKRELLYLLNDIYAANPYGHSLYSSKESMRTFSETVLSNPFKADDRKWMVYGGLTYNDDDFTEKDSTSYENIKSDGSIFGAYGLAEYGVSDITSAGVIVGGNNNKVDISNGSKLEGDSFYIGAFGKTEVDNFRFIAGVGYQYTDYDSKRIAANKYQSHKYEESYSTNGLNAYIGSIYSYELEQSYFLEPKINLTYTRISQNSIDEGNKVLAIESSSKTKNYLDGEIGIDLVKEIDFYQDVAKIKGGISYIRALSGANRSSLKGNMKGGSDFDILIPEKDKVLIKIGASFEVEQDSGFIYDAGVGFLRGSDTDDYYLSGGIGYKF